MTPKELIKHYKMDTRNLGFLEMVARSSKIWVWPDKELTFEIRNGLFFKI